MGKTEVIFIITLMGLIGLCGIGISSIVSDFGESSYEEHTVKSIYVVHYSFVVVLEDGLICRVYDDNLGKIDIGKTYIFEMKRGFNNRPLIVGVSEV
jgi:hypothetical protein